MDDGDQSTQIIRVWGLESHNTLDRRVWEAISRHSKTRGKEYRRRYVLHNQYVTSLKYRKADFLVDAFIDEKQL